VANNTPAHVISIVLDRDREATAKGEQRGVRVEPRRAPKRLGLHRNQNFGVQREESKRIDTAVVLWLAAPECDE